MYKNKTELMGFLGGDAVVRTDKNNEPYTTLRLATTESYKDKTGKYVERTEWHNIVVYRKLGVFAAKLKKGAHIEVHCRIRYSEYKGVQTTSLIAFSILKLDRAAKAAPEDEFDDIPSEGEAA